MLEVIEEYGGAGSMTHFPNMLKKEIESMGTDLAKATSDQLKQAKKTVRDKFSVPRRKRKTKYCLPIIR